MPLLLLLEVQQTRAHHQRDIPQFKAQGTSQDRNTIVADPEIRPLPCFPESLYFPTHLYFPASKQLRPPTTMSQHSRSCQRRHQASLLSIQDALTDLFEPCTPQTPKSLLNGFITSHRNKFPPSNTARLNALLDRLPKLQITEPQRVLPHNDV